jgi:hypothetical protein
MAEPDLVLDLHDDHIIVAVPDRSYATNVRKSADGPWLLVASEALPDNHAVEGWIA